MFHNVFKVSFTTEAEVLRLRFPFDGETRLRPDLADALESGEDQMFIWKLSKVDQDDQGQ